MQGQINHEHVFKHHSHRMHGIDIFRINANNISRVAFI